jgi:putative flippase GtrA
VNEASGFGGIAQRRGVRQFVKFGIVGASGFVVNLVIFTLLQRVVPNHAATVPYLIIYSIAFLSGGVSNYFLNRAWTFKSTGHVAIEGVSFLGVSVLALLVALVVSQAVSPWLAHGHKTWFVATVSAMFVNFFVNKYWTFRSVL